MSPSADTHRRLLRDVRTATSSHLSKQMGYSEFHQMALRRQGQPRARLRDAL